MRRGVEWIADPKTIDPFEKARGELIGNRAVQNDPASRRLPLPVRGERAEHGPVEREIEVGVVVDDQRVLGGQLQGNRGQALTRPRGDAAPDRGGAGVGDEAHIGMLHQAVPDLVAQPKHRVDDTGGNARLVHQLLNHRPDKWSFMGRFVNDGISEDEGGEDFQRRLGDRKVPGRERHHDAERFPAAEPEFGALLARDDRAILPSPLTRPIERHMDQFLDVAVRVLL